MKTKYPFLTASALAVSLAFSTAATAATFQVSADATAEAQMDGNDLVVKWTDPLKVSVVEHYRGHLDPKNANGRVDKIRVGDAKEVRLKNFDPKKDGLNMQRAGGDYLLLQCGADNSKTMPGFKGLEVDCSKQQRGILRGVLVVEDSAAVAPPATKEESRAIAKRIASGEAPAPAPTK